MRDITSEPVHLPPANGSLRNVIAAAIAVLMPLLSVKLSADWVVGAMLGAIVALGCLVVWWMLRYNDKQDARIARGESDVKACHRERDKDRENTRKRDVLLAVCAHEHRTKHRRRKSDASAFDNLLAEILGEDESKVALERAQRLLNR